MKVDVLFKRVPISEISEPGRHGAFDVYKDFWWAVDEDDNVFLYRGRSPQANLNKDIAERLTLKNVPGAVGVKQIPYAYVAHKCEH